MGALSSFNLSSPSIVAVLGLLSIPLVLVEGIVAIGVGVVAERGVFPEFEA